MRVLMTGAGGSVTVSLIEAVRAAGPYIVGVDADALAAGEYFVDRFYQVPMANDPGYITFMKALCREEKIDVALINVDEEIKVLAKEDFSPTVLSIANPESTLLCLDKLHFYQHLKNDFNLPKLIGKRITKPRQGRGSAGIEITEDSPDNITQEFIEGDDYTVDVLRNKEREFLAVVPRLRISTDSGQSIKGRIVHHETLIAETKRLVEYLDLWGAIGAQWMVDQQGIPWLLEINPRLAGGMNMSAKAGANIPAETVKVFAGQRGQKMDFREMGYLRYWDVVMTP